MFRSKKFFTALGIGILLGALIGAVYVTQRNNLPDIFQYVPTGMEQVMVNRAERNIQNNINNFKSYIMCKYFMNYNNKVIYNMMVLLFLNIHKIHLLNHLIYQFYLYFLYNVLVNNQ